MGRCRLGHEGQCEHGALARFALRNHVAAHHAGKAPRDRQAKAGAPKPACRRGICLREISEKAGERFVAYSNTGIADLNCHAPLVVLLPGGHADLHLTGIRKLDGV